MLFRSYIFLEIICLEPKLSSATLRRIGTDWDIWIHAKLDTIIAITGFTTGGVAGLTTLEFEPGMVYHDLKAAMDVFSPYRDEQGNVIYYHHHDTWHDDNGSSHIKAALLSPFIVIPFVNGEITIGPWQNLTLVECDTRNRVRDIVFQVMGE